MKKAIFMLITLIITNYTFSQNVDIKDGDGNSLITVNDEGTAGSITIPSGAPPSSVDNKLYHTDGLLVWSGNALSTGNPLWSINGSGDIYRNTGKVGIGTTSPTSTLYVVGENSNNATGYFENTSAGPTYTYAVYGDCSSGSIYGIGGSFKGVKRGVVGEIRRTTTHVSGGPDMLTYRGVDGFVLSSELAIGNGTNYGVRGDARYGEINYGVYGQVIGGTDGYAIYGTIGSTPPSNSYAGYFNGRGYFSGNTGIRVEDPQAHLHVEDRIRVGKDETYPLVYGEIFHTGGGNGFILNANANGGWADMRLQTDGTTRLFIESGGNVGIGTTSPVGKLDVNGSIYQRGTLLLHADYVFEDDYELESIEEHSKFMWTNKHLKAIPKAQVDENGLEFVEVGSHRKGIVEELEKAHIYIENLHNKNIELEDRISELEYIIKEK